MVKELKSVQIIKKLKLEYDSKIDRALQFFEVDGNTDELYKAIAQLLKDFLLLTRRYQTDTLQTAMKRAIDENWIETGKLDQRVKKMLSIAKKGVDRFGSKGPQTDDEWKEWEAMGGIRPKRK